MSGTKPTTPPPPNPAVVANKVDKARQNLQKAVKDFLQLLDDKVLEKNKSEARKNVENMTAKTLYDTAVALEQENQGEGVLAMSLTTLRTTLKMRDRINELEFLMLKTARDLKIVEEKLGTKKDEKPKG
jgi:hypothetical protein